MKYFLKSPLLHLNPFEQLTDPLKNKEPSKKSIFWGQNVLMCLCYLQYIIFTFLQLLIPSQRLINI